MVRAHAVHKRVLARSRRPVSASIPPRRREQLCLWPLPARSITMASCGSEGPASAMASEGDAASKSGAAASAEPESSATSILDALCTLEPRLDGRIGDMKARAKELKAERKRIAKELRNAEKRRRRLRARCKELPAEDLLEVLAMRRVRDAEAALEGPADSQEG